MGCSKRFCNHGIRNAGFDDPRVTHVVIVRPTVSLALFGHAIVGGLREPFFGDTDECYVLAITESMRSALAARISQMSVESWTRHVSVRR